ncbi:MAG: uncharacterized protein A8A55_1814 [Amphiamblys sp. WSBS2006]|nr:MAG: uncharacterized protein A8A55_1814 [Amphiamblys sp. WSBS2006]
MDTGAESMARLQEFRRSVSLEEVAKVRDFLSSTAEAQIPEIIRSLPKRELEDLFAMLARQTLGESTDAVCRWSRVFLIVAPADVLASEKVRRSARCMLQQATVRARTAAQLGALKEKISIVMERLSSTAGTQAVPERTLDRPVFVEEDTDGEFPEETDDEKIKVTKASVQEELRLLEEEVEDGSEEASEDEEASEGE